MELQQLKTDSAALFVVNVTGDIEADEVKDIFDKLLQLYGEEEITTVVGTQISGISSLNKKISISRTIDSEITKFDIDDVDPFTFILWNKTSNDIEITESADIDLHGFGTMWLKADKTMQFTWIGGKAIINYDDKYWYMTYDQFRTRIDNKRLVPCSKICLVDFETIYDQPDYFDDGGTITPKAVIVTKTLAVEKLVLLATSNESVAKEVWSISKPKDYIEYDYSIDETYVNQTACKGKITFRRDENGNEANCDTNILLKRYDRGGDGVFKWYYDSGADDSDDAIPIFGIGCYNNKFDRMSNDLWTIVGTPFPFDLENFVFGSHNIGNSFGILNNNNTWGNWNYNNTWGVNNYNNIWGNSNNNNIWGSDNYKNIWGNDNDRNIWRDINNGNIWGDGAIYNKLTYPVTNTDFTLATHIYADYDCIIYEDKTDGLKLRYMDSGSWVVADIDD